MESPIEKFVNPSNRADQEREGECFVIREAINECSFGIAGVGIPSGL